jgi:uncharacterized membrane protein YiaA
MSEPGEARRAASPVLSVLMLVIGTILVLPGLCSGYFALLAIGSPNDPYLSALTVLWLVCFAVAAVGIALIVWSVRRLQRTG